MGVEMAGRFFYSLCLCLGSAQVLPLRQWCFIKSAVVVGERAGVSLVLWVVERLMQKHAGHCANQQCSGLCPGERKGFWGQGFQGAHSSAKACSL